MGLYSNTRVDSLNEYASEEFKRTVKVESLIEACIEIRENDYKMFESLLNLDFAEASMLKEDVADKAFDRIIDGTSSATKEPTKRVPAETKDEDDSYEKAYGSLGKDQQEEDNEVGPKEETDKKISSANKAKKNTIWSKIVGVIETVIKKIKEFFSKVIDKISSIIHKDSSIVEKYKSAFTDESLKGFEGMSDISVPKKSGQRMHEYFVGTLNVAKAIFTSNINDMVSKAKTKEDVDKIVETDASKVLGEFTEKTNAEFINKEFFDVYSGENKFKPTKDFMQVALDSVSARSGILEAVKKADKDFEKNLNDQKAEIKKKADEAAKKDSGASEVEVAKAAGAFKIAQRHARADIKVADDLVKAITKAFGSYRKIVLVVGRYALSKKGKTEEKKEDNKEAAKESALMEFAICEASDLYIAEALSL